MENNQSQKSNIGNETKGRGLFYGVIAIATFIIMAVGATFAYFTATTNSMNTAVQTGSTTLELEYISYGTAWMKSDLIPVDTLVAEYSFENQNDTTITDENSKSNTLCVDDDGNSICSVYVFQVKNTAKSEQEVSIDIVSETNGFASLKAMAYEISLPEDTTEYESKENSNGINDPVFLKNIGEVTADAIKVEDGDGKQLEESDYNAIYVNRKGVQKTLLKYTKSSDDETGTKVMNPAIERELKPASIDDGQSVEQRTAPVADSVIIDGQSTKTFAIVLYILNKNENQTATDAAKLFAGQVVVGSGDGVGVSGQIEASIGVRDLQSQQSNQ